MANNKSAVKRNRQQDKRRLRTRLVVGSMRTAIKKARLAIDAQAENATELVRSANSLIDRAVSKGAVKRSSASRYISRLATRKPPAA